MALLASFLLLFTATSGYACTCGNFNAKASALDANGNPVKIDSEAITKWWSEQFKGAVFVGNVTKIERVHVKYFDKKQEMKKVTVNVERTWLGVERSSFVIYTAPGHGGDCGVHYVKGQRYFFYAPVIGGLPETNSCSPNDPDNDLRDAFVEMLGAGKTIF